MTETIRKCSDKHPLLFSLAAFGLAMPVTWGIITPWLKQMPMVWGGTVKYTLSLLVVFGICLAVYGRLPFTLSGKGFVRGLFGFGLLGLICAVMAFLFSYQTPVTLPSVGTVTGFTLYSLAIALSEEFLFRGLILSRLLYAWRDRRGFLWWSVTACSVLFGLRHLLNLIEKPYAPVFTVGQVVFTFLAGFYLCAVYLRTENLWVCVCIHFAEDFLTGFWALFVSSAGRSDASVGNMALLCAVHSVYVIFGVLMLRDKHFSYQPIDKGDGQL